MKKLLIKIVVCLLVFLGTIAFGINYFNQGNSDMTSNMSKATFPLVHIKCNEISFNTLRGMVSTPDLKLMRDTITPLEEGRKLTVVIDKYENKVDEINFEVRNLDGTRLIEKNEVTDYRETEDSIVLDINIKDLIENDIEYNWILKLTISNGNASKKEINYYTRIINITDSSNYEKLSFVSEFNKKTFDKELVKELSTYLEPKRKADNTTYNKVDIHCSMNQISWGDLNVYTVTEPELIIKEVDKQTASIKVKYRVETDMDSDIKLYNIEEYYRIRVTKSRIYLLEFERSMNQIFDPKADVFANNKIMLGIRNDKVEMEESSGGSNLAFINEGQLLCYHSAEKKFSDIFSFYDGNDLRSICDNYGIKILSIDEIGNVSFAVYGYMNRGQHEGEVGILVYQYNGMMNQIEELVFIPSNKTFDIIQSDIKQLSYKNKNGIIYLYLDGTIMSINPETFECKDIATKLSQNSFKVSENGEMLVWQNSSQSFDCTKLILMNLTTGVQKEIISSGNTRMMPLGFIDQDLIYGVAHYEDILEDSTGTVTFPMYIVYIQNEKGDILKKYEPRDAYVIDCNVVGNMITLNRVKKENNSYVATIDDQIVNNVIKQSGYNGSEIVVTQNYEKIIQLVLKNKIEYKSLKITEPKEVIFSNERNVQPQIESIERYYVYSKEGVSATYSRASDAVNLAYSLNGSVIDESGRYIWRKGTRSVRNQIMKIKGRQSDDETSDLAVCIETMLEYKGYSISVEKMLKQKSVMNILSEQLSDVKIVDLKGVSLDAILYYINMDIPVLALLNDGSAVLIVGYNELNIVVMDPTNGKVYKKGMNDSRSWFLQNGNQFITYAETKER